MITIIITGFILFIVGVTATIIHDKIKEVKARQPAPAPKATRTKKPTKLEENFKTLQDHIDNVKKQNGKTRASMDIDNFLAEAYNRKALGYKTVSVRKANNGTTQTIEVDKLIAKLEDLKKRL